MDTIPIKLERYFAREDTVKKIFFIDFNHTSIAIEVTAGFDEMYVFEDFLDTILEDKKNDR